MSERIIPVQNDIPADTSFEDFGSSAQVYPEVTLNLEEPGTEELGEATDFIYEENSEKFWCPHCGGWHGSGPPPSPSVQGLELTEAPPVPEAIGKIIRKMVEAETNVRWKPLPKPWPETGFVDDESAAIRREGDGIEAIWGGDPSPDPYNHRHIASKDGINANYVRDMDDLVIVDDKREDPYGDCLVSCFT